MLYPPSLTGFQRLLGHPLYSSSQPNAFQKWASVTWPLKIFRVIAAAPLLSLCRGLV
jgi:hypothetical protein